MLRGRDRVRVRVRVTYNVQLLVYFYDEVQRQGIEYEIVDCGSGGKVSDEG